MSGQKSVQKTAARFGRRNDEPVPDAESLREPAERTLYEPRHFSMPPFPALKTSFYGRVALMNTEGFVHIRTNFMQNEFTPHVNKWQSSFGTCRDLDFTNCIIQSGAACLVRFAADGKWYRATYLGVHEGERLVFYEDFGSVDAVSGKGDIKMVDPKFEVGYEIPTSVYSCLLVNPANEHEYLVLTDSHLEYLRIILIGGWVDGEVVGYRFVMVAPGLYRECLAVHLFPVDNQEANISSILLNRDPDVELRSFYPEKVTLDSSPGIRRCTALQFPQPHRVPTNQKCVLRLQRVYSDIVTVSFPPSITVESWQPRWRKIVYCDADIAQSLEKNWTSDVAKLRPAKCIMEKNSYLVLCEGKCRRAEVQNILKVDESYLSPTVVEVLLIDIGERIDVNAEDLFDLPDIIPVQVAKRSFEAEFTLEADAEEKEQQPQKNVECVPICGIPRALAISKKCSSNITELKKDTVQHKTVAIVDEKDLVEREGTDIEAEWVKNVNGDRPILRFYKKIVLSSTSK